MSCEKRARRRPLGVASKNSIGHLRMLEIKLLCKIAAALRPANQARNVAEYIVITMKRIPLVAR